jgi:hypothetical protein
LIGFDSGLDDPLRDRATISQHNGQFGSLWTDPASARCSSRRSDQPQSAPTRLNACKGLQGHKHCGNVRDISRKGHRFPPFRAGGSTTGLSVTDASNRATVGNLSGIRPLTIVGDSLFGRIWAMLMVCTCFLVPQRGARMIRLIGCIAVTQCGNVAKRSCLDRSDAANRFGGCSG